MLLREGQLVAFGTETVYGLGADACNGEAVARIYQAKGRPSFNPLICHYASAMAAFCHVRPNALAERLAAKFWPGPLTLVLPRAPACPVSKLAAAGLPTLAVRVPGHALAHDLLAAFGGPVAAPSANRSGHISPTRPEHVLEDLDGRISAVLDCGPCPVGVESTVLDLSGETPTLLRPGGVAAEDIAAEIGPLRHGAPPGAALASPGLLASHYAPALPVRLNAEVLQPGEALLAFGAPLPGARTIFQLSARRDVIEAAANLFEGLHELDAKAAVLGLTGIAVQPIPELGIGLAINDRLTRASAPKT